MNCFVYLRKEELRQFILMISLIERLRSVTAMTAATAAAAAFLILAN